MALYRYIENKEALLDAVQEGVVAEMRPVAPSSGWRDAVEASAREFRRVLAAHPNAITLFVRPAATDGAFKRLEEVWRWLVEAGFCELDALRAFQSLLAYVVGQAMWQYSPEGDRHVDDEFEFGVDIMLRGIDARLAALG